MLIAAATGSLLSTPWIGVLGENEPQLVLQLSWFALLFAAVDGLLIEHNDSKK